MTIFFDIEAVTPHQAAIIHRHLDLLYVLIRRNLKVKYQGSVIRILMDSMLQPALVAVLLITVFTQGRPHPNTKLLGFFD